MIIYQVVRNRVSALQNCALKKKNIINRYYCYYIIYKTHQIYYL